MSAPPALHKIEVMRAKYSPSSLKGLSLLFGRCPKGGVVAILVFVFSLGLDSFAQVSLIPRPQKISKVAGSFKINTETKIYFDGESENAAYRLQSEIKKDLGLNLEVLGSLGNGANISNTIIIAFTKDCSDCKEQYSIKMSPTFMMIYASDEEGASKAISTFKQLYILSNKKGVIPNYSISDGPAFLHRGLLLDCSRHFFSVATVKKYIDLLAFYKMNTLHWHLTEDQGWRIQINKYPKLTEVGAWRTEKDGSRYGGFYSKKDIKDVIAYADARGITVIPEIEMPGHSQAAIAAYPHLSCTGEQVNVVNDWGVFKEIYCAGNDSVFVFLEDVLSEVMELFPSKYIHVGGDEAPKFRWEHCEICQKRMADEGLKDEHELQSYFITRIEKFLNANGRELIGWDEILEGGLSPNASVQSWHGMEHGKIAAQQKHNVVMSPTSHCYLDYGLDAIDLEKVYRFNPIPEGLEKEFEQYILGAEVNMWTEHVPNDSILDSRVFPRLIAMAEVLWSGPGGDYQDFYNRLQSHYPILEEMGVKSGLEAEPITIKTFVKKNKTYVEIIPGLPNLTLEYSLGDGLAYPYKKPFVLQKSTPFQVMAYKNTKLYGDVYETKLVHHKALGITPKYTAPFSSYYTAGGQLGLTDGLLGSLNFRDGRWQGYSGNDVDVVLDLGEVKDIESVQAGFYQYNNAWVFFPKMIEVEVSSNGIDWEKFGDNTSTIAPEKRGSQLLTIGVAKTTKTKTRYIRFMAKNIGKVPNWHEAAGSDAWIFIDEIIVR
jgi:hexosaminidase